MKDAPPLTTPIEIGDADEAASVKAEGRLGLYEVHFRLTSRATPDWLIIFNDLYQSDPALRPWVIQTRHDRVVVECQLEALAQVRAALRSLTPDANRRLAEQAAKQAAAIDEHRRRNQAEADRKKKAFEALRES